MTLILKHANKNRLGAIDWGPNDFDVCVGDRGIGRIFLSPQSNTWPPLDMDNHSSRLSTIDPHTRLFSDTRASDGGFQSAVVKHTDIKSRTRPRARKPGAPSGPDIREAVAIHRPCLMKGLA
jgi:hypothetical protein